MIDLGIKCNNLIFLNGICVLLFIFVVIFVFELIIVVFNCVYLREINNWLNIFCEVKGLNVWR